MDTLTQQQRRANMAAIHSKDTKPEMVVRRFLWRRGYRYRVNHPRLPGKPDIVMLKYRTCIFVNGCFWHGHNITFDPSYPADNEKTTSMLFPDTWSTSPSAYPPSDSDKSSRGLLHDSNGGTVTIDSSSTDVEYRHVANSACCRIPKSNTEFWIAKIRRNHERDLRVQQALSATGWHCLTIWECELQPQVRERTLQRIELTLNSLFLQDHNFRSYATPEEETMIAAEEMSTPY